MAKTGRYSAGFAASDQSLAREPQTARRLGSAALHVSAGARSCVLGWVCYADAALSSAPTRSAPAPLPDRLALAQHAQQALGFGPSIFPISA